jgi:hypothetical protein
MSNQRTIDVVGGNCFAIAARELGDATQGVRIAQINGLSDPFLAGPITLLIPPIDRSQTGGLPAT